MLWYKAWLETRTRFVILLLGISALCWVKIYIGDVDVLFHQPSQYRQVLDAGHAMLCFLWMVAVILLTMGGLLREKATGAAPFTLSIPVSRARLVGSRIGVVVAEAVVMAVIPWGVMYVTATVIGMAVSTYQASFLVVLLLSGGMVFFGIALLVSSLVEGEYTAPTVSLGIVFVGLAGLANMSLDRYSPLHFAAGGDYLDKRTSLLVRPFPWMHALGWLLFAAILMTISVKAIEWREF